jgi:hypothetical protein
MKTRSGSAEAFVFFWKKDLDELKCGKVTIAVANYPMSNWKPGSFIPAGGPVSVWAEEQKLPPIKIATATV